MDDKSIKIIELIDVLCDQIILQSLHNEDFSLIGGKTGIAIAFYNAGQVLNKKKYLDFSYKIIDNVYDNLDKVPNCSYSEGIAGIIWGAHYIPQIKHKYCNEKEMSDIDDYLLKKCLTIKNYDLFYGIIGYGLYFIMRHKYSNQTKRLEKIIEHLLNLSYKRQFGVLWQYNNPYTGTITYDLGSAHGLPSIISFLCKIYPIIQKDRVKVYNIILQTIEFLINVKNENESLCLFPNYLELDLKKEDSLSRLGWCYGDLGISNTFYLAGKTCKCKNWIDFSKKIALKASERQLDQSFVKDASFCHGISGIIYLFKKYYSYFQNEKLLSACEFWVDNLIKMWNNSSGLTGLYFYSGKKYVPKLGILEGYAGIILSLTYLLDYKSGNWDESLLLS